MDRLPRLVNTRLAAFYIIRDRQLTSDDPRIRLAIWTVYRWARDGKLTRHGGPGSKQARWDLDELDREIRAYLTQTKGVAPWETARKRDLTRGSS